MFKRSLSVLLVVAVGGMIVGCNRKPDPRTQPGFQNTKDPSTITTLPPDPTKTGTPPGTGSGSGPSNG